MEAVYIFRKDYPYLDSFNEMISVVHECGFQIKWFADICPAKKRNDDEKQMVVLTLQHNVGAFLFFLGIVVCYFSVYSKCFSGLFKEQKRSNCKKN